MKSIPAFALTCFSFLLFTACTATGEPDPDNPPRAVGESAPDFELESLRGGEVTLSELAADGPVVLLVLRGYPGYQCPICNRQMGDYFSEHERFAELGARVVLVYPGPSDHLKDKAEEFVGGDTLPDNFDLLIDPDYTFTNAYNLRWNQGSETAYPSTFVIAPGEGREITFAKVSYSYGNRTNAADILAEVEKIAE
ncbi:MAG: redoxin domain-containing protein [Planctomycetota bacterium]